MMNTKWAPRLAGRTGALEVSRAVTEILRLTEQPDIISFAGGLPDPSTFLLREFQESSRRVLSRKGAEALNYGPTAGYSKLREWIAQRMLEREAVRVSPDNILVTSGGLEALNLIAMALLEPGCKVLVGAPSYLAALHVFGSYQCRLLSVPVDANGLDPLALEETLSQSDSADGPRLLYVIPSFQNPSGATLSLERRHRIIDLCSRYGVPIVEDHAYSELRYEGDSLPSLKSLSPEEVIFIHTFSKICAPGLRLGWVAADKNLIDILTLCKIGTDQCAGTLSQRIVHDFASQGGIERQIQRAIPLYRHKRDQLQRALGQLLPSEVNWNVPQGGFYIWLQLPPGEDSRELLRRAIAQEKVAFVAGPPFFANGEGKENLRLCFSFISSQDIPEGVRRLAAVLETR